MDLLFWLLPATIDLSDRTLTLPSGEVVPVAVGKPSTPTPTGEFYVMRKVINPNGTDKGVFGKFGIEFFPAYGIHGTNEQTSIGKAVTNGCIRVPRYAEDQVFKEIKWATPIIIQR